MASPHFDLFAAVRAGAVDYKLNTGAVSAVTAELVAGLTILYRIGADVVFWAFARRVASLSPFVETGATNVTDAYTVVVAERPLYRA